MSRQECRLALQIIQEEFGPVVAAVARPLLIAPRTLRQLCDLVKQQQQQAAVTSSEAVLPAEVQASLLVLLQHDIVVASEPRPRILYSAAVHRILLRHRFPR